MVDVTERILGKNGDGGKYYESLPRANEIFEPPRKADDPRTHTVLGFIDKVTDKDFRLLRKTYSGLYLTQVQVAKRTGLSLTQVNNILSMSGKAFSKEAFKKLTDFLGISDKMECLK
jgi:hypothetical protein